MICISLLFMLCVRPTPVYAEEMSEAKTVRVGYFTSRNFQEGGADEHKRGAGYEYLQKIASLTGWNYEYVYAPFGECLEMLENGEIDLMGDVNYTLDRSRRMRFSAYPQGSEEFWLFTNRKHEALAEGGYSALEGCRIGVNSDTYPEKLLEMKQIEATVVSCTDDQALTEALAEVRKGDYATADRLLDGLEEERPDDLNLLLIRSAAQVGAGSLFAARRTLERAMKAHPKSYLPCYNLANLALRLNENLDVARDYYEQGRALGGPRNEALERRLNTK